MKYLFLSKIDSPADVKKLSVKELDRLAEELRDYIIAVVSQTGGHLAPSLGVVELTLALHYVFDAPTDKIIWDVGHQAYAHKIITGRRDAFATNRCWEGISGFPRREESPYDAFGTGHASTSISAGFGIVCARDTQGGNYKVVSVIGDGALTGGLALEGLNNAGASGKDFIVVLNDNLMSISPNVGALHNYFTMLMTHPTMKKFKDEVWDITGKLPSGDFIQKAVGRIDAGLKSMVTPGALFEAMGFRYLGPVNGHNLDKMIRIFSQMRELKGPQILHVMTQKGRGYKFAEEDATRFHGLGAFDKTTGTVNGDNTTAPSYTEIFGQAMMELAAMNNKIIAITAAMTEGTGLADFKDEFPPRFYDVGIAEGHAVTFAAGLAVEGMKPVVAIYSTFLQRAFDHIIHDVALQKLPVIFALDRAGVVGEDGPTHHGCFDISYLRQIPNLVIMVPRDENELRNMLFTALKYEQGPSAIRYPRSKGTGVTIEPGFKQIPLGKGQVMHQGREIAILAVGPVVYECLKAGENLRKEGLDPTVVDMKFVKPLDWELLKNLTLNHHTFITVEENAVEGGFGSRILEYLATLDDNFRLKRIGIPDRFIEQGPRKHLLKNLGLTGEGIKDIIIEFVSSSKERQWSPKN